MTDGPVRQLAESLLRQAEERTGTGEYLSPLFELFNANPTVNKMTNTQWLPEESFGPLEREYSHDLRLTARRTCNAATLRDTLEQVIQDLAIGLLEQDTYAMSSGQHGYATFPEIRVDRVLFDEGREFALYGFWAMLRVQKPSRPFSVREILEEGE
jgi:hypothetical protein